MTGSIMSTFVCIFFRNADNNFFLSFFPEVISAVTYPIATFVLLTHVS